jgi:hypothetical protein
MNTKKLLTATVVVFVLQFVFEYVIHNMILKSTYASLSHLWRTPEQMKQLCWIMMAGYVVFAPAFSWIYAKGYEKGKDGFGQGLRYGITMGLILAVFPSMVWFVVLPIPANLAYQWASFGLTMYTVIGVVVGLIYKP